MRTRFICSLLGLLAVGCSSTSGIAKGAYGIEYMPARQEIGQSLDLIISTSEQEAAKIKDLVRDLNAREEGLGTGALIGAILPRVAMRVITEAEDLETKPIPALR